MAGFIYLAFVLGIVLVAVYGAVMAEVFNPMLGAAETHAATNEAATGVMWAQSFFELLPLVLLGLLVFILIVGVVVRRGRVGGGGI